MRYSFFLCMAALVMLATGCTHPSGLVVTHTPNPSDIHDAVVPEGRPFPHMWFYRTDVRNRSDVPIRITRFEGYFYRDSQWVPANILNRELTSADFSLWYAQGDPVTNGWIQPQSAAACDPNWHGATSPVPPRCKWTYDGVDSRGRTHHAEAEILAVPAKKSDPL